MGEGGVNRLVTIVNGPRVQHTLPEPSRIRSEANAASFGIVRFGECVTLGELLGGSYLRVGSRRGGALVVDVDVDVLHSSLQLVFSSP